MKSDRLEFAEGFGSQRPNEVKVFDKMISLGAIEPVETGSYNLNKGYDIKIKKLIKLTSRSTIKNQNRS